MAKKNPAVLWNVDQTGDVIGAAGRQRAQKNIGITDGEGKLIGQSATNSFMTSITLDASNELKAEFGRPTLADVTPDTSHKNYSIGTNSETGAIEAQDLKNPSSSPDGNGTTYVSSVQQASNGKVSYKTQTITEATDESHSAKKGITTLISNLYASNERTTGYTTAVTPDGVWDAIDSLDVTVTGFGADKTLQTLTETGGKIAATFQDIAIGGSAVTLNNASQAVVTDANKKLTTKDLSVSSSTDETATNKFVSTVTADSTGKITVKKANVALDGTETTLDNASQAVVTDGSKHLTTENLTVNSATDENATNKFVSSVTANAKGKITVKTANVAIDGTATTLDNASQAVVTDGSKHLTTKDLSVSSSTDESDTNKFVSSVTSDATGKITVKKAGVAIGGSAVTLNNASQAVVTDASKNLTTEDLSVSSATDGSDTNKFVSSVTANAKGKITVTKGTLSVATDSAIGGVKSSTTGTTANRDYNVEVSSTGTMKTNVPWINTDWDSNTYSNLQLSSSIDSTTGDRLLYANLNVGDGLSWVPGSSSPLLIASNIYALTHDQAGDHEEIISKFVIDTDFNILSNGTTNIGVFAPMPQNGDTGKIVAVNGDTLEFIKYTGGGVKNIRFSVNSQTAQDDVYNEIESCYDSSQYKWTILPLLTDEYGRHWQLCAQGSASYAFMTRGNGKSYLMNFSHYTHMPTVTTFNDCIVYDIESGDDIAYEDLCKEIWNKASIYGLLVSIKDETTQCYAFASMVAGVESSPTVQFTGIDGTQVRVFTIGNGTSWKWVTSAYTYLTPFRLNIVDNANPKHYGYNCEINGSSNAYEASLPKIINANEFIGPLTGTATKATNADITRTASIQDGDLWQIGNGTSQRLMNAKYAYYDHNNQLLTKRQLPWKFTTDWAAYRTINSAVSCPANTYTILELDPSTVTNFPISGAWLQLASGGKPGTSGGWRECEVVYDAVFRITNPTSDYLFAVIELLTFGNNLEQTPYCARSAKRLYLVPGTFAYSAHCSFHLFIDDNGNVDPDIAATALINGAQCRLAIRPNSTAITIDYAVIWAGVIGRAYDID